MNISNMDRTILEFLLIVEELLSYLKKVGILKMYNFERAPNITNWGKNCEERIFLKIIKLIENMENFFTHWKSWNRTTCSKVAGTDVPSQNIVAVSYGEVTSQSANDLLNPLCDSNFSYITAHCDNLKQTTASCENLTSPPHDDSPVLTTKCVNNFTNINASCNDSMEPVASSFDISGPAKVSSDTNLISVPSDENLVTLKISCYSSVAEPSNISNNSSLENISYGDKLCPQDKINYLESKLQIEKEKSDKITSDWFDLGVNSNTSYAGDEKHLSYNNGEVGSNCAVSASDTVLKLFSKSQKLPGKTHSSPLFTKVVPLVCGEDGLYSCHVCDKKIHNKSAAGRHIRNHVGKKLFSCHLCGKMFASSLSLQSHFVRQHNEKLESARSCPECGKMFVKRSSLQVHLATHTNNKPFICEVCGQGFSQKVSRDIHLVRHTGKYNYKCIKCDKSFPCRSKLNAHSYIHKTPRFACSVCRKKFVHRDTLRTHLLIHADKKPHQCSECHRAFTTKSNLRQHEQSHSNLLFSCEQCGARFRYQSSLTSHRRCHEGFSPLQQKETLKNTSTVMPIQERFLCPVCGKEFQRKHSLKTHEKCHRELSEGEVHLCHLCPNKYTQKSKLTQHLKTHLQEPQFCCEVCKKCFYRKDVYVKHMTTHSDQRPYCCAHCGKAFTFKSNLTAHLAMHPLPGQPIQMFRCSDCGREFRHKSSYTVHRKSHLGQFSHSCPTCGKQFTQKSRLASHIHCHSTDRPFVCPTCGRAYKEHKHRREHIKRAHPQEFSVESLLASITGDDTNVLGTEQQPLDGEHSLVTITNQSACIQDHLVNHLLSFPSVDHQTILEQNEQSELVVPFSVVQDECSLLVLSPNVAMYPPVDLETTLQDIQPTHFSTSPGDAMHCQGPLAILSGEDTTSVLSQGMT